MSTMHGKKDLIEELKRSEEVSKLNRLEGQLDRLEEYLDKIYKCVNINNIKEKESSTELSQHNLKKRAQKQTFREFNGNKFSDILIVEEENKAAREQILELLEISERFILDFDKNDDYNLLFYGSTGTGKSYLANCIANDLVEKGYTVRSYSAIELFDFIKEALIVDRNGNLGEYKMLTESDLLIIDDLGVEINSSFTVGHLFSILNDRILNCKQTIICTNLNPSELGKIYTTRILSRMVGEYRFCKFIGQDLRWGI